MKSVWALSLVLLIGCSKPEPKPNILLILTDDQGYGDVALHGNPYINTPNIDRIALEGARMDRFLVSSVCAPTRASLLTGRYHLRAGTQWVTRGLESMHPDETTFAQVFKQNGYRTALFGKWHNGAHYPNTPNGKGFDLFFGFNEGHINNYFDTDVEYQDRSVSTRGYLTDVLTDSTLAFMSRDTDQPFFAFLSIHTPHSPFQVPDSLFDANKAKGLNDKDAAVYGMVENIDQNIGRILRLLDERGLSENTIVIFMTDNGPNGVRYNAGMRGIKASVHEGGLRVPFFIRWPNTIPAGTVRSEITAHIDLLPTLVDLTGAKWVPSKPLDGKSFASLLTSKTVSWPDRALFAHHSQNTELTPFPGSVRTDRYRAVNLGDGWELYDMIQDGSETINLADSLPSLLSSLSKQHETWFEEVTRDLPDGRPIPIGYADVLTTTLPAPEALFSGSVRFAGSAGWANDWLTGMASPNDTIWWDVNVLSAQTLDIWVQYTLQPDITIHLNVTSDTGAVSGPVVGGVRSAFVPSPDRVPRGEVYEKTSWAWAKLGPLPMTEGKQRLVLTTQSRNVSGFDIKSVQLRLPE